MRFELIPSPIRYAQPGDSEWLTASLVQRERAADDSVTQVEYVHG